MSIPSYSYLKQIDGLKDENRALKSNNEELKTKLNEEGKQLSSYVAVLWQVKRYSNSLSGHKGIADHQITST